MLYEEEYKVLSVHSVISNNLLEYFKIDCAEFLNATEIKQLHIIRNMNNKYFNNL